MCPRTLSTSSIRVPSGSTVTGGNSFGASTRWVCQPVSAITARPSGYSSGLLVSTITPTPLERTTSPIATPAM